MAGGRTKTPVFNCTACPSKYLSQSGVDTHFEKDHGSMLAKVKTADTPLTNQPFSTINNASNGGRRQKIPDYKCPQCPSRYLSVMGVENHVTKEHPKSSPIPTVSSRDNVSSENNNGQRRRTQDYKCPHCTSRYLSQSGVDQHVVKDHANLKESNTSTTSNAPRKRTSTFNCPHCVAKYLSQSGVDAHVIKEHGDEAKDKISTNRSVSSASNPSNASNTPRRKSSTFDCNQCTSKYLTQNGLNNHVEKDHKTDTHEEETNDEDGLTWPPEKGSVIATLFEDNFYVGRVLRISNENSAKVRYMERYKGKGASKNEDQYWVWPKIHETYETKEESVLGTNLIIEKDLKLSNANDTIFELKDCDTWSKLTKDTFGEN